MRIVNRDLTKESVYVYVSSNQIYARIWFKNHGKWEVNEYFQSHDFLIDKEIITTTIKYIKRTWGLSNPVVVIE